ncbi:uncharacterized protein LOC126199416 [Schistocerca nitens]|uniref:uncharacterized protein LOC126199416 n=1 Tax=Schistocerca nitens TaxID=7011 RepID=UPI00211807E5|nr:uncharacterized protein LOC126199416 [Schistocerca nitens]
MEEEGSEMRVLLGSGASLRRLLGLWWPQRGRGRFRAAASASVTLLFLAWLPSFTALKLIMDTSQELDEIALCCLVIFVSFGFVTKVSFFIYQSNTLHYLLRVLYEARRFNRQGKDSEDIRHHYQRLSHHMFIFMEVSMIQALAGWVSTPLLTRAFLTSDDDSVESSRQFPVPLWFPGNIYLSPTYEILYIVQFLCIIVAPQTSICIDVFFIHMMLMVAAELEVLNANISAMKKVKLRFQSSEYQEQRPWNKEKHEEVDINGYSLVSNTGSSSTEDVLDENMNLLLVKNIQHHQSEKLSNSAVSCDWTDCDTRFKRSLFVFLTVAGRPLEIIVGKTSKLSKETLVQDVSFLVAGASDGTAAESLRVEIVYSGTENFINNMAFCN